MTNSVQKWGNSLGLRIPATLAADMGIKRGSRVKLQLDDGVLTVRPVQKGRRRRPALKLANLLSQITSASVEPTYQWGPDVGEEIP